MSGCEASSVLKVSRQKLDVLVADKPCSIAKLEAFYFMLSLSNDESTAHVGYAYLPSGNDDILATILNSNVSVWVHNCQITRMEIPALECLLRRLRVSVIFFHGYVSSHNDLANRLSVIRHIDKVFGILSILRLVYYASRIGSQETEALARKIPRAFVQGSVGPSRLSVCSRERPVRLGRVSARIRRIVMNPLPRYTASTIRQ